MINDSKYILREKISKMLSKEEWLVCFFSAIPNIFTEELLIWCLSDELSIKTIKDSISKLVRLDFLCKQYNKENICFFTMHERFRQIMNDTEDTHYTIFCKKLVDYYNYYIGKNKVFSSQYYNDKLSYQLILNDNTEWRYCYQYIFEKGDYFECEKLLNIYEKSVSPNNRLLYAWYHYYKLQNKIANHKYCTPEVTNLESFSINDKNFITYWLNICGVLYVKCGKYKKAENFFREASVYVNTSYEAYVIQYNICVTCFYTQQYIKAFKLLSRFCNVVDSNDNDLYFLIKYKLLISIINMRLYKLDTALKQFEEVLNLKEIYQTQLKNTCPLFLCQKHPRPLCASIDKDIYNYMGEIYLTQGKFQQAIQYHLKGLKYNEIFGNPSGMAWANNDLGKTYYISGDTQTAQKYLEKSIRLFECSNDNLSKAFPLMELSFVYQYNGDVEHTIQLLKESFLLLRQRGLINDMLTSLNNLGRLYQSQGFLNVAKIIFEFCLLKFCGRTSVKQYLGWINNNIARNYLYANEFDIAITYFNKALNFFKETNEKRGRIYVLNNIGETYAKQQKYDEALELLTDACREKEEMGDLHGICYSYREIGELYIKLNRPEVACSYFDKALNLCEQGNFVMLKGDIWTSLGNYYFLKHNLELAVNYFLKALDNYKGQNFYSRILICTKKINEIIQKNNYINMDLLDETHIYNKLKTDETKLIQEIQGLLDSISD